MGGIGRFQKRNSVNTTETTTAAASVNRNVSSYESSGPNDGVAEGLDLSIAAPTMDSDSNFIGFGCDEQVRPSTGASTSHFDVCNMVTMMCEERLDEARLDMEFDNTEDGRCGWEEAIERTPVTEEEKNIPNFHDGHDTLSTESNKNQDKIVYQEDRFEQNASASTGGGTASTFLASLRLRKQQGVEKNLIPLASLRTLVEIPDKTCVSKKDKVTIASAFTQQNENSFESSIDSSVSPLHPQEPQETAGVQKHGGDLLEVATEQMGNSGDAIIEDNSINLVSITEKIRQEDESHYEKTSEVEYLVNGPIDETKAAPPPVNIAFHQQKDVAALSDGIDSYKLKLAGIMNSECRSAVANYQDFSAPTAPIMPPCSSTLTLEERLDEHVPYLKIAKTTIDKPVAATNQKVRAAVMHSPAAILTTEKARLDELLAHVKLTRNHGDNSIVTAKPNVQASPREQSTNPIVSISVPQAKTRPQTNSVGQAIKGATASHPILSALAIGTHASVDELPKLQTPFLLKARFQHSHNPEKGGPEKPASQIQQCVVKQSSMVSQQPVMAPLAAALRPSSNHMVSKQNYAAQHPLVQQQIAYTAPKKILSLPVTANYNLTAVNQINSLKHTKTANQTSLLQVPQTPFVIKNSDPTASADMMPPPATVTPRPIALSTKQDALHGFTPHRRHNENFQKEMETNTGFSHSVSTPKPARISLVSPQLSATPLQSSVAVNISQGPVLKPVSQMVNKVSPLATAGPLRSEDTTATETSSERDSRKSFDCLLTNFLMDIRDVQDNLDISSSSMVDMEVEFAEICNQALDMQGKMIDSIEDIDAAIFYAENAIALAKEWV